MFWYLGSKDSLSAQRMHEVGDNKKHILFTNGIKIKALRYFIFWPPPVELGINMLFCVPFLLLYTK